MTSPTAPRLEERRAAEFTTELEERARAWMPEWGFADSERDFGRALLEIAARFSSEVAERLDRAGEKMRRGFLDWLAERGEAARPSRMPVVFKLADTAREAVLAEAPVRMQADADGTPVVFETEHDVRIIPGRVGVVVGVDASNDAFYLPPPGLSDLEPPEPLPTEWQLKSFAAAKTKKLQLDPETGLAEEMLIEAGGNQYRITKADNEIVTIDPALDSDLDEGTPVRKVESFAPFETGSRNRQAHALYLGHMELLNIEAEATIEVVGASTLVTGIEWQYWGKTETSEEPDWIPLPVMAQKPNSVVLQKPKGAVEPRPIGGVNSRWIRAYAEKVEGTTPLLRVDALELLINCETLPACPAGSAVVKPSTAAEAMANTTPLVLDNIFFPLGKEPRQFDAFYLGSEEAFSKEAANVQLCFEMADRTFSALAAVRDGTFANSVLAGIAKDRSLHLLSFNSSTGSIGKFRDRDPLQPPRPGYLGSPAEGTTLTLDAQPAWRLPVWSEPDFWFSAGFLVATAARDAIWIWHEHSFSATSSGWVDFGRLPTTDPAGAVVDGLVYLAGVPGMLAAVLDGELFKREWLWPNPPEWTRVTTQDAGTEIKLRSIVPVMVQDAFGRLVTSRAAGMIGVDDQDKLYRVSTNGNCTPLLAAFDFNSGVRPVAIEIGGVLKVAAVTNSDPPELVAKDGAGPTVQEQIEPSTEVLAALDAVLISGKFYVLATVRDGAGGSLATWAPFEAGSAASVFLSPVGPSGGNVEGAALAVGNFVVIAGARADILVSEFDPSLRLLKSADVEIGVVLPDSIPALSIGDLIVRSNAGQPVVREITHAGLTKDGEVFYRIDSDFPPGVTGLDAYDLSPALGGTFADPKLTLDSSDDGTDDEDWLLIDGEFFKVLSIATNNNNRIAKLKTPNANGTTPPNGNTAYVRPIKTNGRIAPFMELNTSSGGNGDWDASLLNRISLIFPGETPEEQRAKAFDVDINNKPVVVVLGAEFQSALANPADFLVDAAFGEWRRDAGDTSTNPELSWEYWNGKGWWKLLVTRDDTQNFKTTGVVRFEVPSDIASSDWSGKTNFWIRARLIGGDYGREEVKVKIKNVTGGSEQTIERSTKGIRPPAVVRLHVSYQLCTGVRPDYVQAEDSGTIRDQSDANRTSGAIVEAFVPLAHMLGRLLKAAATTEPTNECPPECGCSKQHAAGTSAQTDGTSSSTAVVPATGRSIFVGLNATPSEAPVNLLLLVEKEQAHGAFAPMSIEALVADRFVPIVAEDKTRALGESGLLSMNFADPPTRSELFGNENLTWLLFSPRSVDGEDWTPSLRGAYLNAAWASATETLTRELVGSSDGEPNLVLSLARPPVLHKSLELRVREPLGEEEREALRKDDDKRVLSEIDGMPGDWVLWKQVIDPDDEAADARVYSLDDANGEIRFGDGRHGKIPPIARDSIVAFSYQRTEPPAPGSETVPGNMISARTALNLVSPVETVESVIAADQAAGGAPPESDERVLRFGFARVRHRERAVSVSDLEDLTLQSSPDIVQARAIVHRGYIRLVVVMKGKNPVPNASQVRELRRLLLNAAPMSLSAPNSLRIAGPAIRKLRVDLKLRIRTLDDAGAVGRWVKDSLLRFFDTATGGNEKDGWALGVNPNASDIAFALIDAPHLEGIANVELIEIIDDRTPRPWPDSIAKTEIVMLDGDPVRIEFETAEVMV